MSKLRNPDNDKRKSDAVIYEQYKYQPVCCLTDCINPLTPFQGPGSDKLCRTHQKEMTEYGGMGKLNRLHTFFRDWICEDCGYDPRNDPAFDDIEDEFHKLACQRATLEGDHQHLKSAGGADTKANIKTRCCRCHRIKTMKNKDYLGNKPSLIDTN
jgi:hypothetical protein